MKNRHRAANSFSYQVKKNLYFLTLSDLNYKFFRFVVEFGIDSSAKEFETCFLRKNRIYLSDFYTSGFAANNSHHMRLQAKF